MNTPTLAIQDAINWMMTHNVMLKATPGSSKHAAISLTPATIFELASMHFVNQRLFWVN